MTTSCDWGRRRQITHSTRFNQWLSKVVANSRRCYMPGKFNILFLKIIDLIKMTTSCDWGRRRQITHSTRFNQWLSKVVANSRRCYMPGKFNILFLKIIDLIKMTTSCDWGRRRQITHSTRFNQWLSKVVANSRRCYMPGKFNILFLKIIDLIKMTTSCDWGRRRQITHSTRFNQWLSKVVANSRRCYMPGKFNILFLKIIDLIKMTTSCDWGRRRQITHSTRFNQWLSKVVANSRRCYMPGNFNILFLKIIDLIKMTTSCDWGRRRQITHSTRFNQWLSKVVANSRRCYMRSVFCYWLRHCLLSH